MLTEKILGVSGADGSVVDNSTCEVGSLEEKLGGLFHGLSRRSAEPNVVNLNGDIYALGEGEICYCGSDRLGDIGGRAETHGKRS